MSIKRLYCVCLYVLFFNSFFYSTEGIKKILFQGKSYVFDAELNLIEGPKSYVGITENNDYILSADRSDCKLCVKNKKGKILYYTENINMPLFQLSSLGDSLILIHPFSGSEFILNCKTKQLISLQNELVSHSKSRKLNANYIALQDGKIFSLKEKRIIKNDAYIKIYPFYGDKAVVFTGSNYSIWDQKKNCIGQKYNEAGEYFSDDLLPVRFQNGKTAFINTDAQIVFYIDLVSFDPGPRESPTLKYYFENGVCCVNTVLNGWVIINDKGKIIKKMQNLLPAKNQNYSQGLLAVYDGEKYGYLNSKGECGFPCIFSSASAFENGCAQVVYKEKDALLFKDGRLYFCEDLIKGNKTFIKIEEDLEKY